MDFLLGAMSPSEHLRDLIYVYGRDYGPQFVVVVTLSTLTIYRRDLSCNRCYSDHEDHQWSLPGPRHVAPLVTRSSIGRRWQQRSYYMNSLVASFTRTIQYAVESSVAFEEMCSKWQRVTPEEFLLPLQLSPLGQASMFLEMGMASRVEKGPESNNFAAVLPSDLMVQVLAFLHPKDVITFSCVNKQCHQIVDGPFATSLWKTLFKRDYGWLVNEWEVGKRAVLRSSVPALFDKEFYFRFALGHVSYLLAGQNTVDCCLVGLGGHIYDLTSFVLFHPGSPETVMIQAGRDATSFYSALGHSKGARRYAQSLCLTVNMAYVDQGSIGVRPTWRSAPENYEGACAEPPSTFSAQEPRPQMGTLKRLIDEFRVEEIQAIDQATRQVKAEDKLGDAVVYYDPYCRSWKAWYTNVELETVYIDL